MIENRVDADMKTSGDFSIIVKNVPKNLKNPEQTLRERFT